MAVRRPVRLLIADDQPMQRTGFRTVLAAHGDLHVVGEACDGAEAVELTRRLLPDVVLMDVRLPRLDGVAATRAIVAAALPVRVLALTGVDPDDRLFDALRAGARGFLPKDIAGDELVAAIRAVAAGGAVLPPPVLGRLLDRFAAALPDAAVPPAAVLATLTDREQEVLAQMARGLTNAEIARRLSVGETTIKTHVAHLLGKLGLRDRVQAVVLAYESGLIRPGDGGPTAG